MPADTLTIRGTIEDRAPKDSQEAMNTEASPDSSVAAMIEARVRVVPVEPDANELQSIARV
jgi:hypothetical protein